MKTFFFFFLETTRFWAQKTFEFPISAEKSLSILVKTFFFFFLRPPDFGRKNHSQFRWRPFFFLFFFFFFGDHLSLGAKNVRISDFGRKITLNFQFRWRPFFFFFFFFWRPPDFGRKKRSNFRFRPKNHSHFRWRHPNFWGFVLKIPPTKIF